MTDVTGGRCFRCGGLRKVMMSMKIDDKTIYLCGNCYRDFTMFLEGYVLNHLVKFEDKREVVTDD